MKYKKVDIATNTEGSEIVAAYLYDLADGGVVIDDKSDFIEAVNTSIYENQDIDLDYREDVIVTAYINENNFESSYKTIKENLKSLDRESFGKLIITVSDYESENYDEMWKSFHKPIELDKIAIVPDWMEYDGEKTVLKIKIGSSFGTGQHKSTILALNFLKNLDLRGKKVIDLGCGSGILGLSALKMGAQSAFLCDIEPVDEALYNTDLNGLRNQCVAESKDLTKCNIKGDIVLSNIYATVLSEHNKKIKSLLNNGGFLILSGLYKEGLKDVTEAFCDLELIESVTEGDWSSVMYRKYGA